MLVVEFILVVEIGCTSVSKWISVISQDVRVTEPRSPCFSGPLQFHEGTEERVVRRVLARAAADNPQSVLDAVDDFCYNENWMMNVGPVKGAFVDEVIRFGRVS